MSLLRDTIQEVNALRYQLEQQEGYINGFLSSNQQQMQLVREALDGSQGGYDGKMLSSLQQAEDTLKKAQREIQQAQTALLRIEMI
ncbi:hypothetical protein [Schaalia cardiffensis]|uniref:hypothetical protein n=1 Tax=Schaalia cardiffensis TaxID=181487 RepID=UPI002AB2B09D|nr:hypothetical protein [Schaalia cardiffensis]